MRVALVVAYDGTDFSGWAAQQGQRTVHGTLTDAVRLIAGEDIPLVGSSRTDAGAHARGQVCHFDVTHGPPPEKWADVLNRRLPRDVKIVRSKRVPDAFHARFSAEDRFYRYRIGTDWPDPHLARFVHGYGRPLDPEKMRQAARLLVGEHDFRSFTEELDPNVTNTRRRLFSVDILPRGKREVWVDVVGTAFLRGMMRRISGCLLEIGRGHRPVEEVSRLLSPEERFPGQLPVVLPANGLCLMRIRYGRPLRDHREPPPSAS